MKRCKGKLSGIIAALILSTAFLTGCDDLDIGKILRSINGKMISDRELTNKAREITEEILRINGLNNLSVRSFSLEHIEGEKYLGRATISGGNEKLDAKIDFTFDGVQLYGQFSSSEGMKLRRLNDRAK